MASLERASVLSPGLFHRRLCNSRGLLAAARAGMQPTGARQRQAVQGAERQHAERQHATGRSAMQHQQSRALLVPCWCPRHQQLWPWRPQVAAPQPMGAQQQRAAACIGSLPSILSLTHAEVVGVAALVVLKGAGAQGLGVGPGAGRLAIHRARARRALCTLKHLVAQAELPAMGSVREKVGKNTGGGKVESEGRSAPGGARRRERGSRVGSKKAVAPRP